MSLISLKKIAAVAGLATLAVAFAGASRGSAYELVNEQGEVLVQGVIRPGTLIPIIGNDADMLLGPTSMTFHDSCRDNALMWVGRGETLRINSGNHACPAAKPQ